MPIYTGNNIANVERIKVTEEGTGGKTYVFETSTNCQYTPALSNGNEVEQRVRNTVMGLLKTDDLVKGYDLNVEDQRFIAEFYALVDGGTLTGSGDEWTKYASPVAGSAVTRKKFTLELYTSDRDTDGDVVTYHCWKFVGCKGTPVGGGGQDGQFTTLRYTINSRPPKGSSAMEVTPVESLPEVTAGN
jgi:hypothetical protein